jgi:hypothetical protein
MNVEPSSGPSFVQRFAPLPAQHSPLIGADIAPGTPGLDHDARTKCRRAVRGPPRLSIVGAGGTPERSPHVSLSGHRRIREQSDGPPREFPPTFSRPPARVSIRRKKGRGGVKARVATVREWTSPDIIHQAGRSGAWGTQGSWGTWGTGKDWGDSGEELRLVLADGPAREELIMRTSGPDTIEGSSRSISTLAQVATTSAPTHSRLFG